MSVFRLTAALALFVALAAAADLPGSARLDRAVTVGLQRAAPSADVPAAMLALLADPEIIIPGLAAAGLILLLVRDPRHGRALLLLAAGIAGVSLVVLILQHVIAHPLPPLALTRGIARRGLTLGEGEAIVPGMAAAGLILLLLHRTGHGRAWLWLTVGVLGVGLAAFIPKQVSIHLGQRLIGTTGLTPGGFPSAHTTRTTLFAGTVLWRVPALAAAVVVSMMASLVYLGVHWMSEVLGGCCLGWACAEVARGLWRRLG
ncbi:MAG TPA: hypothetical protein VJT32_12990 [bacterium]|nr:hypothetical protein [bacterium]